MDARKELKQSGHIFSVEIERIIPDPDQPRKTFEPEEISTLANSIALIGQLQPIEGRLLEGGKFILTAGERRLRACKYINEHEHYKTTITHLKAVLEPKIGNKEISPKQRLIRQLGHDDHRVTLSPLEIANAYKRLRDEFEMSVAQIAEEIGCSGQTVRNMLALESADPEIKDAVKKGALKPIAAIKTQKAKEDTKREVKAKIAAGERVRGVDIDADGKPMTSAKIEEQIKIAKKKFDKATSPKERLRMSNFVDAFRITLGQAEPLN